MLLHYHSRAYTEAVVGNRASDWDEEAIQALRRATRAVRGDRVYYRGGVPCCGKLKVKKALPPN